MCKCTLSSASNSETNVTSYAIKQISDLKIFPECFYSGHRWCRWCLVFAYQDQSRGRVLVQLYSGNVVFLGPPSLEEYQMHRVQRFNIQSRIYTYVNYTLQFNSEPMRPLSMPFPMTNVSTHRFDYVASSALYSEAFLSSDPTFLSSNK